MQAVTDPLDPLMSYRPSRQAEIIRMFLIARTRDERRPWVATETVYRSPDEIRETMQALDISIPCPPRRNRYAGTPRRPTTSSLTRIFDELVDVFDDQCAACGLNPVEVVDHDHYTGLVRGLLCRECNHRIDGCLHVDDKSCYRAAYLNDPPAERFSLRYPLPKKPKLDDLIRREVLGFNFLDARLWPHSNPADWTWTPPSPNALDYLESERRALAEEYFAARNGLPGGGSDG